MLATNNFTIESACVCFLQSLHSPRMVNCLVGKGGIRFREPVTLAPDMASVELRRSDLVTSGIKLQQRLLMAETQGGDTGGGQFAAF
jgi:hypothetical protein